MVRRLNLRYLAATATVFGAAFAMRIALPWRDGALHYQMHNDDGVYYSSAVAVLHGVMPYSDFIFLHPPGILVLLAPFAAIGELFTDSTGLFLARGSGAALGSVNAVLVMALIWKYGRVAAIGAGLFYAVWGVVAIPEAAVVNLVTVLNTMFLLAALTLQRWPRRTLLAGVFIGVACATKLWAGVFVLVFVPYVWVKHGRAAALRFVAGAASAGAIVCLPFAIADPARAWQLVVIDQLGRGHDMPPLTVVLYGFLSGVVPEGDGTFGAAIVVAALAAIALPLIVTLGSRTHPREWGDASWLAVLIAVQMIMFVSAPVFYVHYAAFVGPAVALMFGGLLVLAMRHLRAAAIVAVPVVTGAAVMTLTGAQTFKPITHEELTAATAGYDCVWSFDATNLVQADVMSRNISNGCGFEIDGFGWNLIADDPSKWQREVQSQIEEADVIIMGVLEYLYLDEINRDYIRANFHNDVQIDPGGVDVRYRYGVTRTNPPAR